MKINIHDFLKAFNKEYIFLYENADRVAGYDEALDYFNNVFLKDNIDFIKEFNEHRKDIISSDREAVAFMFAMEKYL